jgi:hypothetical protein
VSYSIDSFSYGLHTVTMLLFHTKKNGLKTVQFSNVCYRANFKILDRHSYIRSYKPSRLVPLLIAYLKYKGGLAFKVMIFISRIDTNRQLFQPMRDGGGGGEAVSVES